MALDPHLAPTVWLWKSHSVSLGMFYFLTKIKIIVIISSFSMKWKNQRRCCCSVAKSCPTLCVSMDWSKPGFPVLHHPPEFGQIHVHWVSDTFQTPHPLLLPSPPALNLSQHQGLLQWVSSLHQVVKVLDLQLQHQSFQWIFRVDFL